MELIARSAKERIKRAMSSWISVNQDSFFLFIEVLPVQWNPR